MSTKKHKKIASGCPNPVERKRPTFGIREFGGS